MGESWRRVKGGSKDWSRIEGGLADWRRVRGVLKDLSRIEGGKRIGGGLKARESSFLVT